MSTVSLNLAEPVGHFLRFRREQRGIKQKDVADAAAISVSMLSQIERGVTSPSIETLAHICKALELSLSDLFAAIEEKSDVIISKRDDRYIHRENGVVYEEYQHYISSAIAREFYMTSLDPGSFISIAGSLKSGGEVQMGVVLSGAVNLSVDGDEYELGVGDVVSFHPRHLYRISNPPRASFTLPKKCIVLWLSKPPRRDTLVFGRLE